MTPWIFTHSPLEFWLTDYKHTFDAWEDGGVKGIVIGRMLLGEPGQGLSLAWQPDPETYRAVGIEPPPRQNIDPQKEKTLHALMCSIG